MKKPEIYVSTDIETDGPIPGPHSMLSFASAAFLREGTLLGTFTRNVETLPGAAGHPDTMVWWSTQPKAWEATRQSVCPPQEAMLAYATWIDALPGKPVFAAYPAGFDFTFIHWYFHYFIGRDPFSHSALDIKTLAMAILGQDYRSIGKRMMPRRWFGEVKHTHVALDDAIEQGKMLCNMLRELP